MNNNSGRLSNVSKKGNYNKNASTKRLKSNTLYILIAGVSLVVLIVAAVLLIRTYSGYANAQNEYDNLSDLAKPSPTSDNTVALNPEQSEDPDTIDIAAKLRINFDELSAVNSDVVGWIYVHDTVVDYPIVRGKDNQYYVNYTFSKTANQSGAIFMDYRNSKDFTDRNTVIYGHNMKNGSMFHFLEEYEDQTYFDSHKLMFLVTPDKVYRMDTFSVLITNYNVQYRIEINNKSDADFEAFVKNFKEKSMVKTDVTVGPKDKIVTLSTCDHQYTADSRIALMAKLTEIDLDTYNFTTNS